MQSSRRDAPSLTLAIHFRVQLSGQYIHVLALGGSNNIKMLLEIHPASPPVNTGEGNGAMGKSMTVVVLAVHDVGAPRELTHVEHFLDAQSLSVDDYDGILRGLGEI